MQQDKTKLKAFAQCPGRELTSHDEAFRADPHSCYDVLRAAPPIVNDDYGCTIFTRYSDVQAGLKHKSLSVDARRSRSDSYLQRIAGTGVKESVGERAYEPPLVLLDDPAHRHIRRLVSKAFNPQVIEAMRPRVEEITRALIAGLKQQPDIDFIRDFAGPLPTMVILDMMGMPVERYADFKHWSEDILWGYDPQRGKDRQAGLREAFLGMSNAFRQAIAARRQQPGGDLISAMIDPQAAPVGESLSELQIISLCTQLMVAGNVTTTDLIGNGMYALLRHPAQLIWLRENPERVADAVEELLRFDCPITETARIPRADEMVGECPVRKGDTLTLSLAAANHDDQQFADPHTLDLQRDTSLHLAFGSGIHVCLGAPLARLESQVAFRAFLTAFEDIALDDKQAPERRHLPFFRGFERLPLKIRAT